MPLYLNLYIWSWFLDIIFSHFQPWTAALNFCRHYPTEVCMRRQMSSTGLDSHQSWQDPSTKPTWCSSVRTAQVTREFTTSSLHITCSASSTQLNQTEHFRQWGCKWWELSAAVCYMWKHLWTNWFFWCSAELMHEEDFYLSAVWSSAQQQQSFLLMSLMWAVQLNQMTSFPNAEGNWLIIIYDCSKEWPLTYALLLDPWLIWKYYLSSFN